MLPVSLLKRAYLKPANMQAEKFADQKLNHNISKEKYV